MQYVNKRGLSTAKVLLLYPVEPGETLTMRAFYALMSLTVLAGLILLGLLHQPVPPPTSAAIAYNDISLYRDVVTDMQGGTGYYEAAVNEARKHHYPLRPFVTVRLPTLAWMLSTIGERAGHVGLMTLALATFCAWVVRLSAARMTKPQYALAMVGLTSGILLVIVPDFAVFHETWAGLLIALSIAIRRKDAHMTSVMIGLVAALTRELACAYLLAMMAMAFKDRNTREAIAWLTAIAGLAVALVLHAVNVHSLVSLSDITSPGWLGFGGWNFVLQIVQWNAFVTLTPHWLVAIAVPLSLFGLTSERTDPRLALVVGGYLMAFLIVGRSDNVYWGLMVAPLWPIGVSGIWFAFVEHLSVLRPYDAEATTARRRNGDAAVVAKIKAIRGD